MIKVLETTNEGWGFWGTAKGYLKNKRDMTSLWNETAKLIQKKLGAHAGRNAKIDGQSLGQTHR